AAALQLPARCRRRGIGGRGGPGPIALAGPQRQRAGRCRGNRAGQLAATVGADRTARGPHPDRSPRGAGPAAIEAVARAAQTGTGDGTVAGPGSAPGTPATNRPGAGDSVNGGGRGGTEETPSVAFPSDRGCNYRPRPAEKFTGTVTFSSLLK